LHGQGMAPDAVAIQPCTRIVRGSCVGVLSTKRAMLPTVAPTPSLNILFRHRTSCRGSTISRV
jgi:hypothetical protein